MLKTVILFVSAFVAVCSGHLCMVSPPQRGSMVGLNKPGASDCILLKSPCGGRDQKTTGIALVEGEQFTVTLQKNLDHYNKTTPGYFSISIGPNETSMKELAKLSDTTDPSLSLYSVNVTMPLVKGHMILQARYVTNNPQAPAVFYQCSDVNIVKRHDIIFV